MKKAILELAKYVGAFTTIAVAVLAVDGRLDNFTDTQTKQFNTVMDTLRYVQKTVDYINVEQTFMADDITGVHDTLEQLTAQNSSINQKIGTLTWGLKHQKQFTPEQFEDILDEMLKKNERLQSRPLILKESGARLNDDPELTLLNTR